MAIIPILNLEELTVGDEYFIKIQKTEEDQLIDGYDTFKGTYIGILEPRVVDPYDHITVITEEDLIYKYAFSPFKMVRNGRLVRVPEEYKGYPFALEPEILRICQEDVDDQHTIVIKSHKNQFKKQANKRQSKEALSMLLPQKGNSDLTNYANDFLGGKYRTKRTKTKRTNKKQKTKTKRYRYRYR